MPYDKIPIHSTTVTTSKRWLLWTAIVLAVLFAVVAVGRLAGAEQEPVALPFYGTLCAISLGAYVVTRTTAEVFEYEGCALVFFRRPSSEAELAAFIDALQGQKLDFLRQRLARRAPELPNEDGARYLIYCRESGLLDEAGYAQLRKYLDDLCSRGSIGFQ